MYDFQIAFGNGTSKRVRNGTTNKLIKVGLKFRMYKSMVFFHGVNQCMSLILDFMRTMWC